MNEFDVEGCFLIYFQFTSKILAQCVEKTNSNAIGLNVTTKQGIHISICKGVELSLGKKEDEIQI